MQTGGRVDLPCALIIPIVMTPGVSRKAFLPVLALGAFVTLRGSQPSPW
jgi:hypothetical protein